MTFIINATSLHVDSDDIVDAVAALFGTETRTSDSGRAYVTSVEDGTARVTFAHVTRLEDAQ
jgi:hypothetical protein